MTGIPPLAKYTPESRMLIDGELVGSSTGAEFDNINPATEEVLGQVADGT
jgi:aldehyde dehydrogenase (NAD+)